MTSQKDGKWRIAATLVAMVLGATAALRADDVVLVRDGKPMSVIVVRQDAGDVSESAARALQNYLRKISGAEIPIMVEEAIDLSDLYWLNGRYTVISIGNTRLAQSYGVNLRDVGPEGFRIETKDIGRHASEAGPVQTKMLFIIGHEDSIDTTQLRSTSWLNLERPIRRRGTLFGVYALLEDYLGVRWLWPGQLGEVVPARRDVTLPEIHRSESPALPVRVFRSALMSSASRDHSRKLGEPPQSMLQRAAQTNDWTQHMRLGQSLAIDQNHSYRDVFWNKHHLVHPKWFALMPDGHRYQMPAGSDRVRLCYSNQELQKEVARMVVQKIADSPAVFSYAIGLDDASEGDVFCQCQSCKEFGPTLSDRVFRYSSEVARLVAAEHANKFVTQFAYSQWADPPVRFKVDERVVISYVGINTHGYLFAPDRRANLQLWDRWTEMVNGKMLWRPNLPVSLGMPVVFIHKMADDLRHFAPKTWGADIDCLEGSWASRGLDWYVMSKLMWDLNRDVDAVIDDYCKSGFGVAWQPVREYFRLLERHTAQMAELVPEEGYPAFARFAPSYYTSDKIVALQQLLTRAAELAGNDDLVRQRVQFLQVGLDWTKISLPAWDLDAQNADRAIARPAVERMYEFLREHRESYALQGGYIESKIGWMWRDFFGEEVGVIIAESP